jgi:hypothetical protein
MVKLLKLRTLSTMTNGPLIPPMVLYLILGWTLIIRGSTTSGMMAVVPSDTGRGGRRSAIREE